MRRIAIVIHEATRTGAPKVAGLIAGALRDGWDTHIVLMKDGPLRAWLEDRVGAANVYTAHDEAFSHHTSFAVRSDRAHAILADLHPEIIYCNSLAASCFVTAAHLLDLKIVIHLHEKAREIRHLLAHDLAKFEIMLMADGIVFAAQELEAEARQIFPLLPSRRHHFGIALDIAELHQFAKATDVIATNHAGITFAPGERLVVGMCGHASARKGADIFLACASALPEIDFIWIGPWDVADAIENIAFADYLRLKPANLYLTGPTANPYAMMQHFDVFFLSSREDPNPLVMGEASTFGATLLAFSETTAVTDMLGRRAILCHGKTNVEDAIRVLRAMTAEAMRRPSTRQFALAYGSDLDIQAKAGPLADFLEEVAEENA